MDGRVPLALAFGLLAGMTGCVPDKTTSSSLGSAQTPRELAAAAETADFANRTPKPSTFVALANLSHQDFLDTNRSEIERQASFDKARKTYQQALQIDPKYIPA